MARKGSVKQLQQMELHFLMTIENWLKHQDKVSALQHLDRFAELADKSYPEQIDEIIQYFKIVITEDKSRRRFIGRLQRFRAKQSLFEDLKEVLLGNLYSDLLDYPMAVKAFEKVLANNGIKNKAKVLNSLAFAEIQNGNYQNAERVLLKASKLQKNKDISYTCQLLGEMYMAIGKVEMAEDSFELAFEKSPDPYTREYIRARLLDVSTDFPIRQSGILQFDARSIFSSNINHLVSELFAKKLVDSKNKDDLSKLSREVIESCNNEMKSSWYAERFSPVLVADIKRQNQDFNHGIHKGRLLEELISRRRQYLTCVKISMQGFTAHFKYLDDQLNLINDFQKRIANIIFRNNGAIDRIQTTNIMAYFGFMYEGNDSGVRTRAAADAIRCAYQLQEQLIAFFKEIKKHFFELPVEKIKRSKGGYDLRERSLGLAIGISTGWCLFGEMVVGDKNGRMMVGHTVNIAHRLTEVAQPREVLTSQTTFDLAAKYLEPEFSFADITSDIELNGTLTVKRLKDYANRPVYKISSKNKAKE